MKTYRTPSPFPVSLLHCACALLLLGQSSCRRNPAAPTAAQTPSLDAQKVQALLARCEDLARAGDVGGFRACLTGGSDQAMDRAFTAVADRIRKAETATGPLRKELAALDPARREPLQGQNLSFEQARAELTAIARVASWPGQLQAIGRAAASTVTDLAVEGERATFSKVRGEQKQVREHHLRLEQGSWKIDLEAGPELGRRLSALTGGVRQLAAKLEAAADKLRDGLRAPAETEKARRLALPKAGDGPQQVTGEAASGRAVKRGSGAKQQRSRREGAGSK